MRRTYWKLKREYWKLKREYWKLKQEYWKAPRSPSQRLQRHTLTLVKELLVRSLRTKSPKPTDWESEYVGLNARLLGVLSTKNKEFKNVPPLVPSEVSNTDRQRTKGTGGISVLTPVSLPFSTEMTQKGRVTWGTLKVTPVFQTPYI